MPLYQFCNCCSQNLASRSTYCLNKIADFRNGERAIKADIESIADHQYVIDKLKSIIEIGEVMKSGEAEFISIVKLKKKH